MADDKVLVTLDDIYKAQKDLANNSSVLRTPVLKHMQNYFPAAAEQNVDLYFKLENMQTMGQKLITISAGNYGKTFAFVLKNCKIPGVCIMPDTAPNSRVQLIREMGTEVEQVPTAELQSTVDRYVKEKGYLYCHSFDDLNCVAAYGSIALEVLEDVPDPDVVLVPCGGGALTAGIAALMKLIGQSHCRVYGVEPEGAATMYESYKAGKAVALPTTKSVAAGLSPPYAGKITYNQCRHFSQGILLVSDDEIVNTVNALYQRGFVVEPSGAAGLAALMHGKVPDVQNKKVVAIISGGNITPAELNHLLPDVKLIK